MQNRYIAVVTSLFIPLSQRLRQVARTKIRQSHDAARRRQRFLLPCVGATMRSWLILPLPLPLPSWRNPGPRRLPLQRGLAEARIPQRACVCTNEERGLEGHLCRRHWWENDTTAEMAMGNQNLDRNSTTYMRGGEHERSGLLDWTGLHQRRDFQCSGQLCSA